MGNQNRARQKEGPHLCSSYITHPKLSSAQVCMSKDQVPTHVQICSSVNNKDIYDSWKTNMQSYRDRNPYAQSLYLPTTLEFQQQNFCGRTGIIKAQYEFMPFILKDELLNRNKINQQFQEAQLWYILYMIVCAGEGLHSRNDLIGDVRPDNIFISEEGEIRLSTLYSFMDEDTGYQKFLLFRQKAYLSPEQMEELQNGKQKTTVDLTKSECFSIGLTLLSIVLLTDNSKLYLNKQIQFDYAQFRRETDLLAECQYHLLMKAIVQGLCEIDQSKRLSCKQVVETLKPYAQSIVNLDSFEVNHNSLPLSIQKMMPITENVGRNKLSPVNRSSYTKVIHNTDRHGSNVNNSGYKINHLIPKDSGIYQSVPVPTPFNAQQGQLFRQGNMVRQRRNFSANTQPVLLNRPPTVLNSSSTFGPKVNDSAYLFQNQNQSHNGFNHISAQPHQLAHFAKQVNNSINVGHEQHRVQQKPVLAAYGRQAFSYKPPDPSIQTGFPRSIENEGKKDGLFDSYDQILQRADKQIIKSKNLFPE